VVIASRAAGAVEHGDRPMTREDLTVYLDDLERLNAWFGGYWLTARGVERLATPHANAAVVVADVGGSRGDLAARLVRRGRARRRAVRVIVVDRDHGALVLGRRRHGGERGLAWVQADARALPLRDGGIDVAASALTLHHLEPEDAVATLREMRRAARLGVVVNDLRRTWLAHGLVTLAAWLFARHPFSRHDGPLSVRRAYRSAEVRELARVAGFTRLTLRSHPLLARMTAVGS
jgi:ubiquinone/menaquinone biosynthesis C-methylase UbiE